MNRLLQRVIEAVFRVQRVHLTEAQEDGSACVLCGGEFPHLHDGYRAPWTCLGLPWRHRHYACAHACTLTVTDDTEDLFRCAIPAEQRVWCWKLGADDVPLHTGPDGEDIADEAYLDALDAQPRHTVEITHRRGVLTTRPLPAEYAERIRHQAECLRFTARTTAVERSAA